MNNSEWAEKFVSKYKNGKKDPDGISGSGPYSYNNAEFYREYAKLLDCRSEKFKVKFDETCEKPGLVFKRKGSKKTYNLKSDQFGFSRPDGNLNYPYDIYLEKVSPENNQDARKNVVNWMLKTRQVGGSFFWPMEKQNGEINKNPSYNKSRGNGSYIQDRVDLTLFEIYEYYKKKEDSKIERNILIENAKKNNEMKSWLNEFKDFEEYVDFFALNPFVDEEYENEEGKKVYIPLNLLTGKAFDKKIERVPQIDSNMTIEKYEEMFDKIVEKIEKRREILYCKYYNVIE